MASKDRPVATKVRIVQALCPARHCILAIAYQPGITAAQADFGSCDDITLTKANAAGYLRTLVEGLVERKTFDPWCGLCRAAKATWVYEDELTRFWSMEEALPELEKLEAEQMLARMIMRSNADN